MKRAINYLESGFIFGSILGFLLGVVVATALFSHAQLAPFDAPLAEQLNGQRQEQYLRLERELERRAYQRDDPCRR